MVAFVKPPMSKLPSPLLPGGGYSIVGNGNRFSGRVAEVNRLPDYIAKSSALDAGIGQVAGVASTVGTAGMLGSLAGTFGVYGMRGAGRLAGRVSTPVGNVVNTAADYVNKPLEWFNTPLEKISGGNTLAHIIDTVVYKPFYMLTGFINRRTGMFDNLANKAMGKSCTHSDNAIKVATSLGQRGGEFSALPDMVRETLVGGHVTEEFIGALKTLKGNVHPSELPHVEKALGELGKSIERSVFHSEKAAKMNVMGSGVSNVAETLKKSGVGHTAANLAFLTASAGEAYLTAKDISSDMHAYTDMMDDFNGGKKNKSGIFDMFFSNLPHGAQVARNSMLLNAGPRAFAQAANGILMLKYLKGSSSNALFFAPMLVSSISQGIGMLTGGNILDVYKEMKKNELTGQQNPPQLYALMLGMASKDLSKVGGENSPFTQALAEIYASQNVSVRDVLRATENGKVVADIKILQKQYEQQKNLAGAKAPEVASPQHEPAASHSHVASLNSKREMPKINHGHRENLGAHTQSVIQQGENAAQQAHGGIS